MRKPINRKRLQRWETVFGVGCFIAGIVGPLVGMLLLAVEWTGVMTHPGLHITATVLLIVGIPLILFAGFCLDWAEAGQGRGPHNHAPRQPGKASLIQIRY